MIGAKNFIGSLIDQWLQKWSNCKILSWDSLKPQKETFQERIFKSTQRFLFWMILTLWSKSCPIIKMSRMCLSLSLISGAHMKPRQISKLDLFCKFSIYTLILYHTLLLHNAHCNEHKRTLQIQLSYANTYFQQSCARKCQLLDYIKIEWQNCWNLFSWTKEVINVQPHFLSNRNWLFL